MQLAIDTMTAPQIQARITSTVSVEEMRKIIDQAPPEMRDRLKSHANTVFAIRRRLQKIRQRS